MPSADADGDASDPNGIFFASGNLMDVTEPKWQQVPTEMLRALLEQRQQQQGGGGDDPDRPACGSGKARGSYNTSLHVFALLLILFLSTAACAFPIIAKRFPRLSIPHAVLFISRHFGTGVLIATAFVHLLPTAFESLTDPCLPRFWNKGYPAMPGAIAMTAVMGVVGIEMFFASRGARHVHSGEYDQLLDPELAEAPEPSVVKKHRQHTRAGSKFQRTSFERHPEEPNGAPAEDETALLAREHSTPSAGDPSPHPYPDGPTKRPSRDGDDDDVDSSDSENDDGLSLELDELDPMPIASTSHSRQPSNLPSVATSRHQHHHHHIISPGAAHVVDPALSAHQHQQKLMLQCLLLEAGILFHSIFIGMALSVSTGPPFLVFLLAISFHQTFEGLALGSRIGTATQHLGPHSVRPWLMCLAFGATTPLGQAIGLGIHNLYDPGSEVGLIVVGVTNAVSSGLLLFAGLVELLAADFLSEDSYATLRGRRRLQACGAVVAGAALMALVGAFA